MFPNYWSSDPCSSIMVHWGKDHPNSHAWGVHKWQSTTNYVPEHPVQVVHRLLTRGCSGTREGLRKGVAERGKYLLIDCTSVRTAKKTELVVEYTDSSENKTRSGDIWPNYIQERSDPGVIPTSKVIDAKHLIKQGSAGSSNDPLTNSGYREYQTRRSPCAQTCSKRFHSENEWALWLRLTLGKNQNFFPFFVWSNTA